MRRTIQAAAAAVAVIAALSACARQPTVAANIALQFTESGPGIALYVYGPFAVVVTAVLVGVIDLVVLVVAIRRSRRGVRMPVGLLIVGVVVTVLLVVVALAVLGYVIATLTPIFAGSFG